jgi:hypothetical protein
LPVGACRNLEVYATVVVGFAGRREIEVGEQDLVGMARTEIYRSRCGERRVGSHPAQFEHPVADVAVLGQMGGSSGFAAAGNHLVERAALGELRVELPAEFTRPAGACVEAIDDGWINVFHERQLLGGLDWPIL